jgi:O-antigen/teichoic acid export membrane protein
MNSPTQLQFNRRIIIENIAALFSGSAIAQGLNAITLLLVARQLGPENYGQYTSSLVFATFCSIVFSLGLDLWLLHEGGKAPSKIANLVGSAFSVKLIIGLVWLVVMFIISIFIKSSALPTDLVRISAITVFISSLNRTLLTVYKALLRNKINSILEASTSALRLLATLLLIEFEVTQPVFFILLQSILFLVSLSIALILVIRTTGFQPTREMMNIALRQAPPYAASDFLAWLYMRQDILIVAFMLGDYAAGIYSPAVGIVNALFLVPATIHLVIVPVLSNLFITDIKQAWKTAFRAVVAQFVVGISLFIGLLIGSSFLPYILGPSFAESQVILSSLSIIIFLHSLIYGAASILVATNQQVNRSIVQAVAVILNASLNFLIIPKIGINGVAYVYIITEIVILIGYTWFAFRQREQSPPLADSQG